MLCLHPVNTLINSLSEIANKLTTYIELFLTTSKFYFNTLTYLKLINEIGCLLGKLLLIELKVTISFSQQSSHYFETKNLYRNPISNLHWNK